MRKTIWTLVMMIAVGVGAIAEGGDRPNGPGAEGKPRNVSTVELLPGAVGVRYSRLGGEVIYVLDGAGTLKTDGNPPFAVKTGTVVQLIANHNHVLTNTSSTQTLKVLVVDLGETGQPRLVLAKSGTRQQETRQQNEGCQVIPNGDLSQQKTNEQDATMKGLVF